MPEINLIKFDGKPIEKLVEVISNGIGTIYKPRAIRKEAEAEAYKIEIIERARSNALSEGRLIEADTYNKIQERVLHKETMRQQNIDNVSQIAAELLAQEQTVSSEPVDNDWTTRYFNIIEDVSKEEMQILWGKILAGEVKQPKSFSIRTLETIRNLSKHEANVFKNAANFAIKLGNENFIFENNNKEKLKNDIGISYADIALLIDIGLMQSGSFVNYHIFQNPVDSQQIFTAGNFAIFVNIKANTPTIQIPANIFSRAGNELIKIIFPTVSFEYLQYFANSIKNENVEVKYAYIQEWEGTSFKYKQPLMDF